MFKTLEKIVNEVKPLSQYEKAELIKILLDIITKKDSFVDLLKASKSSTDFWENSIDDEVWNAE